MLLMKLFERLKINNATLLYKSVSELRIFSALLAFVYTAALQFFLFHNAKKMQKNYAKTFLS